MGKMLGALTAVAALLGTLAVPLLVPLAPAEAITAELAKKCRQMAVTVHPSARPGTRTGAQKAQNEYYRECVAKDGNMDDKPKTNDKAT
ncbi:MAG: hypothetical protein AB1490_30825 [Pseudomonadota bacterium]